MTHQAEQRLHIIFFCKIYKETIVNRKKSRKFARLKVEQHYSPQNRAKNGERKKSKNH